MSISARAEPVKAEIRLNFVTVPRLRPLIFHREILLLLKETWSRSKLKDA